MRILSFIAIHAILLSCIQCVGQEVENLGVGVNSAYEEREPILSPDGKTLYFWRRLSPDNTGGIPDPGDIWYASILPNQMLLPAARMGAPLNSKGHDFVWKVSERGDTLWLHQSPKSNSSDGLAYSIKDRYGDWTYPKEAFINNFNYSGKYKDFFMTRQGHMLIPNAGEGTYGGTDIYVCFPIDGVTWSKPINLGPVVNSAGDEDAPFISADGKTLYFSSNGHGGYGDHDIFRSRRLDDTWQKWSEPENLGQPVNTSGYDFDFILSPDEKFAYWGSDRNSLGKNDLYRMPLDKCEVDLYPEGDQTFCEGETARIEAGFSLAEDTLIYEWYKDGMKLEGAHGRILDVSSPGNYFVKQYKDGCSFLSKPKRIKFRKGPSALITKTGELLCVDDSLALRAVKTEEGLTFEWIRNGLTIPQEYNQLMYVKRPGNYQVKIANEVCSALSEPVNIKRISSPSIYFSRDTMANARLRVPKWTWTNKLSRQRLGTIPHSIAVGENQSIFTLSMIPRKKGLWRERITQFFPAGPVRWEIEGENSSPEVKRYICVDPNGNLIITRDDKYLAKYSYSGELLWELPRRREQVSGVTTDPAGYIYTLGRFKDTLYIGDEIYPGVRRGNMYVAKHDPNGDLIWVNTFSADWEEKEFGNAIHTDQQGNIYLAGAFNSIANFRERILRTLLKSNSYFLAKFSNSGQFLWAQKLVTDRTSVKSADMHTDSEGNTFLFLNYKLFMLDREGNIKRQSVLEAPGIPERIRIASHNKELFVSGFTKERGEFFTTKWDRNSSQILLWRSKETMDLERQSVDIAVGHDGSLFITGSTKKSLPPGVALSKPTASPVFVAKYGKPQQEKRLRPISLCESESGTFELYARVDENVSYRWIKDGQEIPGEHLASLSVSEAGNYQVKVFTASCEQLSAVQEIQDCGERVKKKEEAVTVVSEPALSKPMEDRDIEKSLVRKSDGQPKRIRGRKAKNQGEVVISDPFVVISVFDHAAFDGDTISLNVNGKWILNNYCLRKKPKEIPVTLNESGANFVILYAHNLGSTPPNTASIMIDDGKKPKVVRLRSNLKSCGTVDIKFD